MAVISHGFHGRRSGRDDLPPGQYEVHDFPVLSAGPTPHVTREDWEFTITTAAGATHRWSWDELLALPSETPTVDLHCVTKWSKFGTRWRGVSLDTLFEGVEDDGAYAMARSYGGYTTDLPLEDLLGGKAWIAYSYDDADLPAEHGGPARLLVPHLYLWKSAKWVNGIRLMDRDEPGFWEGLGYHAYGDPWREQRYQGD